MSETKREVTDYESYFWTHLRDSTEEQSQAACNAWIACARIKDARITELQAANTREVERRRVAEAEIERLRGFEPCMFTRKNGRACGIWIKHHAPGSAMSREAHDHVSSAFGLSPAEVSS